MPAIQNMSEEVCSNLFNVLPGVFLRCLNNDEETLIYVSDSCQRLTGYHASELQGAKAISFHSLIHPEDRVRIKNRWHFDPDLDQPVCHEYRIITKHGFAKWVRETATLKCNDCGDIWFVDAYLEDITASKDYVQLSDSFESYQTAINSGLCVSIADPQGNIIFVNDLFCHYSKYSNTELIGKTYQIINSGYHSSAFFEEMWQTLNGGKIWRGEIKNKAKDGSYYWLDAVITPVFNKNGDIYQLLSIWYVINDKKEAEDKMKRNFIEISNAEKINQSILRGDNISQTAVLLLNVLDEITGVKLSSIYIFDDANNCLKLAGQNIETNLLPKVESRIATILSAIVPSIAPGSFLRNIIDKSQQVVTSDHDTIKEIILSHIDDEFIKTRATRTVKFINFNTFGIIPLKINENLVGLITFASTDVLSNDVHQAIYRFSNHAAIVLAKKINVEKLESATSKLRFVNDNSPDQLITVDKNLSITYINHSKDSFVNENAIGQNIVDFVPEEFKAKFRGHLKSAFNGVPQEFEIHGNRNDFKLKWYSIRMSGINRDNKIDSLLVISTNITDKKLSEEKIKDSEERYRTLFERNLAGVYRASLDDVFLECNDAYAQLIGFNSAKDVVGKHARELYENLSHSNFVRDVHSHDGKITGYESLILLKNGKLVYCLENASLIMDSSGEPMYMEGTLIDITQKVETEKELVKSQTRYMMLLDNMNEGFVVLDVSGKVTYANKRFCNILGFDISDIENVYVQDYIAEDSRRLFSERFKQRISGETIPGNVEYRCIRKDRRLIWLEINVQSIAENDAIVGIQAVVQDITDKKTKDLEINKLADLNRKIIDSSDELFYVVKVDNAMSINNAPIYLSSKACDFFGIDTESILTQKQNWFDALHPDDIEIVNQVSNDIYKTKKPAARIYRMKNVALGEYIWIYDFVTPVLNADGEIEEMYGSMKNITELKNREFELEKTAKDLNSRYNELMQFNYIVSHNLRAPVANILGLTTIFEMEEIQEEEKLTYLKHINTAARKIDYVIKDLNSILETRAALNENKEKVSIDALLFNISETLSKQISESGTTLKIALDEDAIEIYSIRGYLESILYNLISNAIKYKSKERPPIIQINSRKVHNDIIIEIADNGTGIDLKKFEKQLFGLYKRFNTEVEGKGLGLYMTKTQIETLGGTIKVESVVGQGTEFIVTLPTS